MVIYLSYAPSNKSSRHLETRRQLFNSLASKEKRYNHYIPPKAIGRTATKLGLTIKAESNFTVRQKGFKDNGPKTLYSLRDSKGISHGEVGYNKKTGKVDYWRVK